MNAVSPTPLVAKATKDRLEFLRDSKGIYGLTVETPNTWSTEPNLTFVLRPDKIREGAINDGLGYRAALHPLPHRMRLFKGTIENEIRRCLGTAMLERTRMIVNGQKTASYDRKRHWGLKGRAECIANNLIGRLIEEAADKDALRLARRFPITERAAIYRAASPSIRFRQLGETFPFLAAILLQNLKTKEVRFYDALEMVERGAALPAVAELCEVPMVLRKIPPGAIKDVRIDLFQKRPELIHAYLPQTQPAIRRWLRAMARAGTIGGPFTEWTARHAIKMGARLIEVDSLISDLGDWVSASYAASAQELPEHILRAISPRDQRTMIGAGERYITRQFDLGMSFATVIQLSDEWHEAVANGDHQNNYVFPEPWCPAGSVNGHEIIPITNGADLYREGKAMHHCVGTYSDEVLHGSIYIYSVREDGERVATAELIRNSNRARLGQVRGPCNKNVDKKIIASVRRWLGQQKSFTFPVPLEPLPFMAAGHGYDCANDLDAEIPF